MYIYIENNRYFNKKLPLQSTIKSSVVPNTPTSLHTSLAAEAHLAEEKFTLEGHTLGKEISPIYRVRARR
jgi:hypothetical protein